MQVRQLLEIIETLPVPTEASAPLITRLENDLEIGPGRGRATYRDQKHHWTRWLTEYHYPEKSARRVYNAINCPPMVFWLAEALRVEPLLLERASKSARTAPVNQASQSAVIRKFLAWSLIEQEVAPKVRSVDFLGG